MRLIFLVASIFLVGTLITGCSTNDQKNSNSSDAENLEKEKGIVASIEEPKHIDNDDAYSEYYYILVILDIEDVDISQKNKDELENLAQDNNGAYYNVHADLYNDVDLNTGTKINIYWNGDEREMNPPVREAKKIEVISE